MEKSMSRIQPRSLTDDELLRQAEALLDEAVDGDIATGLPLDWQNELAARLRVSLAYIDELLTEFVRSV
jgi:hypothetical protein